MFSTFYTTVFFKPILNFVVYIYNTIPEGFRNMGITVIIVIFLVRIFLIPLTIKETRTRKLMKHLQDSGEIKALEEHKKDPQVYMAKMKALYAKYKLKPMTGTLLSLLFQLPMFFALYRVFRMIIENDDFLPFLYKGNTAPETFNISFFGAIDLSVPNIAFAVVLGIVQYLFMAYGPMAAPTKKKVATDSQGLVKEDKANAMAGNMGKMLKNILPIFMVMIGLSLPSGITLYIILSVLINWVILTLIDKYVGKKLKAEFDI
jgi:YidC/Oxa1 family membrane protein insertase